MTEFKYVFHENLEKTINKPVAVDRYDCILLDCSGITTRQILDLTATAEYKLTKESEIGGVLIIFYEDTLAFMRHLWMHLKQPKDAPVIKNLKLSHVLHIASGPNRQIPGGGVNGSLFTPFQRVAAVFFTKPDAVLMNPSGEKNTSIESGYVAGSDKKTISGEIFSRIFYRFKYDGWRSVFIGGFERFFLREFVKTEPKKPSERFAFTVFIGESNIRSISNARMMCAAEEIGADFSDCPTAKEVSEMLKAMREASA